MSERNGNIEKRKYISTERSNVMKRLLIEKEITITFGKSLVSRGKNHEPRPIEKIINRTLLS